MKIKELEEILIEMAVNDLAEGSDIDDHPCMVAIRAIEKAFISVCVDKETLEQFKMDTEV